MGLPRTGCDHSPRQSIERLLGRVAQREGQGRTCWGANPAVWTAETGIESSRKRERWAYEFLTERGRRSSGPGPRVVGSQNEVSEADETFATRFAACCAPVAGAC
jgi:hypothetical protein